MAIVVLSPHLDDAAFVLGGTVAMHTGTGREAVVISVFAGDAPGPILGAGREFHQRFALHRDLPARRRDEDRAANDVLGSRAVHLSLPEALYRTRSDGTPVYETFRAIFSGSLTPSDDNLAARIGDRLATDEHVRHAEALYTPLGIGRHVDHLVARAAAEAAATLLDRGRSGWLRYYEDMPYAMRLYQRRGESRGRPSLQHLAPRHWERKIAAITCYHSQLPLLWPTTSDWRAEFVAYAHAIGGTTPAERTWYIARVESIA